MAEPHGPVRTCIGCREHAARDALVRYVLEQPHGAPARVVRDDGRGLAGRGAWLHDHERCRQLADKRRAFRRALRIPGGVEVDVVHEAHEHEHGAGHVISPD